MTQQDVRCPLCGAGTYRMTDEDGLSFDVCKRLCVFSDGHLSSVEFYERPAPSGCYRAVSRPFQFDKAAEMAVGARTILGGIGDLVSNGRRAPYLRAKAGEYPRCWKDLIVKDDHTGQVIADVVEVDCAQGWVKRRKPGGEIERIEGRYRMEWRADG